MPLKERVIRTARFFSAGWLPPALLVPALLGSPWAQPANSVVAKQGKLKFVGNALCNQAGAPIQLMGLSTYSLPFHSEWMNASSVKWMADNWKIDVIRMSMYVDDFGKGYVHDHTLADTVARWVNYCNDIGIYAIIDWHILEEQDRNPQNDQADAIAFFKDMATRFKGYKNVLYEICNEPNNCNWKDNVKPYAEAVIPAIRAIDPTGPVICGTPNWSHDLPSAQANPLAFDNVGYTLHFYAASSSLDGSDGTNFRNMITNFMNAGHAVFVTEWGACTNTGDGNLDTAASRQWMDFLKQKKISHVIWNLSNHNESAALLVGNPPTTGGWENNLSAEAQWITPYWRANVADGLPPGTTMVKLPSGTPASGGEPYIGIGGTHFDLMGRPMERPRRASLARKTGN